MSAPRRRPFGVLIVALLQLGTVSVAFISYLSGIDLPWEGAMSEILAENSVARIGIAIFGVLVAVAAVGMWKLRRWGWALMITLVALSLVLDISTWARQGDQERHFVLYLRMLFDVVSAFYLNSSSVQAAFSREQAEGLPGSSTASAGRVDP